MPGTTTVEIDPTRDRIAPPIEPGDPEHIVEAKQQLADLVEQAKKATADMEAREQPPTAEVGEPIDIKALALGVAVADVVSKVVKESVDDSREVLVHELNRLRIATGVKSLDVLLDPTDLKSKVGTVTLNEPSDKAVVTDENAFAAWVEKHYPTEVEYVVRVRESWQKPFLDGQVSLDTATGACVDPESGEIVPGLTARPGGDPTNVTLRFTPGTKTKAGGRDLVKHALNGRTSLPAPAAATVDGEVVL